jgi:VanZ family protein
VIRVPLLPHATKPWIVLRALAWVVVAAIIYASLFPFQLSLARFAERLEGDWFTPMLVARSSPVDTVANLFFYIPLGFAVVLRGHASNGRRLLVAVGWCAALSASMEFIQHATTTRTPSALDFGLNVVSGTAGGLLALASSRIQGRLATATWLRSGRLQPVEIAIGILWLCLHAAPFIPRMGVYRTIASLDEVRGWEWTLSGAALWSCRHLLMALSLRLILVREKFWQVYLLALSGSLLAQAMFIQHKLSPDEIIGGAVILATVTLTRGIRTSRILLPTCALALAIYGLSALAPFDFSPMPQHFRWLPFTGVLESGVQFGFFSMVGKLFVFLALLWMATRARIGLMPATLALFLVSLLLEVIQIYLPGRAPEMTDPVLVLVPALLLWLVNRQETGFATVASGARENPRGRVRPG